MHFHCLTLPQVALNGLESVYGKSCSILNIQKQFWQHFCTIILGGSMLKTACSEFREYIWGSTGLCRPSVVIRVLNKLIIHSFWGSIHASDFLNHDLQQFALVTTKDFYHFWIQWSVYTSVVIKKSFSL
jgi:hypothetical protein